MPLTNKDDMMGVIIASISRNTGIDPTQINHGDQLSKYDDLFLSEKWPRYRRDWQNVLFDIESHFGVQIPGDELQDICVDIMTLSDLANRLCDIINRSARGH